MPSPDTLYARARAQIVELARTQPQLEALPDYYQAILQAQQEAKASFQPDLTDLDIQQCRRRNAESLPLLEPADIKIDWQLFDDLLGRIILLGQEYSEVHADVARRPTGPLDSSQWRDDLPAGVLQDKALLQHAADKADVDCELFGFLVCHALNPFMEAYAEALVGEVDDKAWLKGYCPICGATPLMGLLAGETGKRRLQCHLCRTDWSFPRVECPFCGNNDQDALRFFYDEADEVNRVEVCDRCKTYLKTADTRKTERDVVLLVENLATIHLDIIARREGFHSDSDRP